MKANRILSSSVLQSLFIGIAALFFGGAVAQEVPYGKSIPISKRDRVYTADQISNTVSVVDPSNNQLLGVIRLGDPITAVLSPLYKGQLLVHGLGFSPDHRTLAVISIGSNSVTLIDTATNKVKGTITSAALLMKFFLHRTARSFGSRFGARIIFPSSILWG